MLALPQNLAKFAERDEQTTTTMAFVSVNWILEEYLLNWQLMWVDPQILHFVYASLFGSPDCGGP